MAGVIPEQKGKIGENTGFFRGIIRDKKANLAEYQVVFEGKLTGELPLDEVKRNLSALFKMKAEQVDALFSGKPVVIKRDIDQATALKYQAAFKKAGAICSVLSDAA